MLHYMLCVEDKHSQLCGTLCSSDFSLALVSAESEEKIPASGENLVLIASLPGNQLPHPFTQSPWTPIVRTTAPNKITVNIGLCILDAKGVPCDIKTPAKLANEASYMLPDLSDVEKLSIIEYVNDNLISIGYQPLVTSNRVDVVWMSLSDEKGLIEEADSLVAFARIGEWLHLKYFDSSGKAYEDAKPISFICQNGKHPKIKRIFEKLPPVSWQHKEGIIQAAASLDNHTDRGTFSALIRLIFCTLQVGLLAVLLGLVLPAMIAGRYNVLYEEDLAYRIANSDITIQNPVGDFSCNNAEIVIGHHANDIACTVKDHDNVVPRIHRAILNQVTLLDTELGQKTKDKDKDKDNKESVAETLERLIALKEKVAAALSGVAVGHSFYLAVTKFIWPALYFTIAWLVWVFPKIVEVLWGERGRRQVFLYNRHRTTDGKTNLSWKCWAALVIFLWFSIRWPYITRNSITGGHDQVVFAWPNWKVCWWCGLMQEVNAAIFATVLALLWVQTLKHVQTINSFLNRDDDAARWDAQEQIVAAKATAFTSSKRVPSFHDRRARQLEIHDLAMLVGNAFAQWQIASIVLVAGFLFYTEYFYNLVMIEGDHRYIVDAVIIHIVWMGTWTIISLPFMAHWIAWKRRVTLELRLQFDLHEIREGYRKNGGDEDFKLEDIITRSPIGIWNFAISGFLAALSLLAPALHALR